MNTIRKPQASKRRRWEKSVKDITNKVMVIDDNFEQAFRKFKRKIKKEGLIQECKQRMYFTKPSEKQRLAKKRAIRKQQKISRNCVVLTRQSPKL